MIAKAAPFPPLYETVPKEQEYNHDHNDSGANAGYLEEILAEVVND